MNNYSEDSTVSADKLFWKPTTSWTYTPSYVPNVTGMEKKNEVDELAEMLTEEDNTGDSSVEDGEIVEDTITLPTVEELRKRFNIFRKTPSPKKRGPSPTPIAESVSTSKAMKRIKLVCDTPNNTPTKDKDSGVLSVDNNEFSLLSQILFDRNRPMGIEMINGEPILNFTQGKGAVLNYFNTESGNVMNFHYVDVDRRDSGDVMNVVADLDSQGFSVVNLFDDIGALKHTLGNFHEKYQQTVFANFDKAATYFDYPNIEIDGDLSLMENANETYLQAIYGMGGDSAASAFANDPNIWKLRVEPKLLDFAKLLYADLNKIDTWKCKEEETLVVPSVECPIVFPGASVVEGIDLKVTQDFLNKNQKLWGFKTNQATVERARYLLRYSIFSHREIEDAKPYEHDFFNKMRPPAYRHVSCFICLDIDEDNTDCVGGPVFMLGQESNAFTFDMEGVKTNVLEEMEKFDTIYAADNVYHIDYSNGGFLRGTQLPNKSMGGRTLVMPKLRRGDVVFFTEMVPYTVVPPMLKLGAQFKRNSLFLPVSFSFKAEMGAGQFDAYCSALPPFKHGRSLGIAKMLTSPRGYLVNWEKMMRMDLPFNFQKEVAQELIFDQYVEWLKVAQSTFEDKCAEEHERKMCNFSLSGNLATFCRNFQASRRKLNVL